MFHYLTFSYLSSSVILSTYFEVKVAFSPCHVTGYCVYLTQPYPPLRGHTHGRHQSQENRAAFPPCKQERPETTNNLSMILVPNLYFETLDV
jgi:hypothetical protein